MNSDVFVCMVGGPDYMKMTCNRCGASYQPALPASVRVIAAIAVAFGKDHRSCTKRKDPK